MTTLTKTGVEFDSFHVWRETKMEIVDGDPQEITTWYISVGYCVMTAEGETWQRDDTAILEGEELTIVKTLHAARSEKLRTKEGLAP